MTRDEAKARWDELNERIKRGPFSGIDFMDGQVKPSGVRQQLIAERDRIYAEYKLWN